MRAKSSGIHLSTEDASLGKAMIARGDRQHDIAAWFGVNGGRIAEIASSRKFADVRPAASADLPPPGPYPSGRDALIALNALRAAKQAISAAEAVVSAHLR